MALDNLQVDYLIDPAFQIENLAGKPAVGGHVEVFEAGTDTKVITYQDFDGNVNPFKIPLHSDGRAVILADPSRKYDFYVYDSFNNLMFSRLNVTPHLSGNISIKGSDVYIYNTDGTLDITQQSIQNNIRRYEINTKHKSLGVEAPLYFVEDSDSATIIGADVSAFGGNSQLTLRTNGIKDGTYDTLGTYTPQGGTKNIDIPREVYTFTIGNHSCFYNDVIMAYLNNKVVVALEIESWYEDGQQKQNVYENFAQKQFWGNDNFYNGGYVNFVRVDVENNQIVTWKCEPETQGSITGYAKWTKTVTDLGSGGLFIAEYGNPGTTYEEIDAAFNAGKTIIAHKKDSGSTIDQYYQLCEVRKNPDLTPNADCYVFVNCYSYTVEELFRFQSNWSNLETRLATWNYVNQQISAGNFATKDYVDSATSGKMDVSGMTAYQPTGDYATHDDLTAYQPAGDYYSASNPSGFITNDALTGLQPSGNYATIEDLESATSGKQDTLSAGDGISIVNNTISVTAQGGGIEQVSHDDTLSGNGNDEPLGIANIEDFVKQNDLTAYQEKGDYYSASNPSGFITNDAITGLQPSGDYVTHDEMTAYQPTGDYATHDDLTGYATTSLVSSVSSELYSAISGISGDYELVAGEGVELVDDPNAKTTTINVTAEGTPVTAIEQMIESATSGLQSALDYGYHDAAISSIDTSALYDTSAHARINTLAGRISNLSSDKLDASAFSEVSGDFYTTANQSGFITDEALTSYQTIEGMTAYQEAGDYYSASNPSGFISEVPDTYLQNTDLSTTDGKVTAISGIPLSAGGDVPEGVMVESGLEYNAVNEISAYNGSAIAQYGAEKQWLQHDDTLVHAANSAQYALGVNVSAVQTLMNVSEVSACMKIVNNTVTGNAGSINRIVSTVSADIPNGWQFMCWCSFHTNGWVGAVDAGSPMVSATDIWGIYAASNYSNTANCKINCVYLIKKKLPGEA